MAAIAEHDQALTKLKPAAPGRQRGAEAQKRQLLDDLLQLDRPRRERRRANRTACGHSRSVRCVTAAFIPAGRQGKRRPRPWPRRTHARPKGEGYATCLHLDDPERPVQGRGGAVDPRTLALAKTLDGTRPRMTGASSSRHSRCVCDIWRRSARRIRSRGGERCTCRARSGHLETDAPGATLAEQLRLAGGAGGAGARNATAGNPALADPAHPEISRKPVISSAMASPVRSAGRETHPFAEGNIPVPDATATELQRVRTELKTANDSLTGLRVKQAETAKDLAQSATRQQECSDRIAAADDRAGTRPSGPWHRGSGSG